MLDWQEARDAVNSPRDQLILDHIPLLKHLVGRMSFDLPWA